MKYLLKNPNDLIGKKVIVHFNLNNHKWSIKHKGKLMAIMDHVTIIPERIHINEKARQRVIKEKCRNLHAWFIGTVVDFKDRSSRKSLKSPISYNPYRSRYFYHIKESGIENFTSVEGLNYIYFNGNDQKGYALSRK